MSAAESEGVYARLPNGEAFLVHAYLDANYAMAEIAECFKLGRLEEHAGGIILTLTRKELRDLRNLADAYSFDYDAGFIEMCLDIYRASAELPGESIGFFEGP
ncbi:MAG TPA: hypothetical protein VJ924_08280 [Alphaproteobacteria bacterium]|nr:hypothetical protein [Alphaproteobacteria bacterium]